MTKKWLVYVVAPLTLSGLMVGLYFSGSNTLQDLVAPRHFKNIHPDSSREFGVLENLQNVFLIVMVIAAAVAVRRKPHTLEKVGFGLLAAFSLFILLEEIDYGLHYYELLRGIESHEAVATRNIHNQGDLTDWFKRGSDTLLVLVFLVLAWAGARSRHPWIRYITPSRWFTLTLLVMVLTRTVAHELGGREREAAGIFGRVGGISRGNLSEFRELLMYYMFMVYVLTLVFYRRYAGAKPESPEADGHES